MLLVLPIQASELRNSDIVEVMPAQYGKYGIAPILGPIAADGTQLITLIVKNNNGAGRLVAAQVRFYSSLRNLLLLNQVNHTCSESSNSCFIEIHVTPDYQNNIELELSYATLTDVNRIIRYEIKELGSLTSHLNKKR